jgi:hypothetical protein
VEKVAVVIDQIITTVVDSIKQIDLTPDWVDDALAEINQGISLFVVVSSLNSFSTCLTLSFNSGLLAVASSWSWNLLSGFWLISAKASSTQTGASGIFLLV